MAKVFFVGPLPPPLHGFSVINERMLAAINAAERHPLVFDLTPRHTFAPFVMWLTFIVSLIRCQLTSPLPVLYLAVSGGLRQLVDLVFIIPAKMVGCRIYIHHHSFSYLNKKPWYSRLCFLVIKHDQHIVLCQNMGTQLCKQYGISASQVRVLSNAAFLDVISMAPVRAVSGNGLTLGFLSNITAEKGIFDFFEVIRILHQKGLNCSALIAGPVSQEIKTRFEAELKALPVSQHVGSVYGEAKLKFFSQINLLLFPSYANEAEPVTLLEAMAHGIPMITMNRGCISGIIPRGAGLVIDQAECFVATAVKEIEALINSPETLNNQSRVARDTFLSMQASNSLTLQDLINEMTN
jgi:glycosyltransferase involved in cell wall biosynthesis